MSMDVPNGLCCRYCGRRWFKHDIQVHEKNCRLKVLSTIKVLEGRYHKMHIPLPPEWEPWILPPKVSLAEYNNYASRFYSSTMPECPTCLRKFPITALNEHINECVEGGRERGERERERETTQKLKPKPKPKPKLSSQPTPTSGPGIDNKFGGPPVANAHNEMRIGGSGKGTYNFDSFDANTNAFADANADGRVECQRCGRKFAPDRISQHERICNKLKVLPDQVDKAADGDTNYARTREPDPSRFKKNGTTGFNKANVIPKALASGDSSPKSNVRGAAAAAAFGERGAAAAAFGAAASANDGRVECRRCGRKFAPDRIDKHESICTSIQNMDPRANNPNLRENASGVSRSAVVRQTNNLGKTKINATTRAPPSRSGGGFSKFCGECGTKFVSDAAKFCMECGAKR